MRTKLPAFTIIELLVVLALSGIIFSMALLVFSIVQTQTNHQAQTHAVVLAWAQLRLRLQQDVQEAQQMWCVEDGVLLSGGPWAVRYRLGAKGILRTMEGTTTHTDTFGVPVIVWESQWQGLPTKQGLVDHLTIRSQFFEQPATLLLHKNYGSHTILNANTTN